MKEETEIEITGKSFKELVDLFNQLIDERIEAFGTTLVDPKTKKEKIGLDAKEKKDFVEDPNSGRIILEEKVRIRIREISDGN